MLIRIHQLPFVLALMAVTTLADDSSQKNSLNLSIDLERVPDCARVYRCESSMKWGEGLAFRLGLKETIFENGKNVTLDYTARLAGEMVTLANSASKKDIMQKNYGAAIKDGFKAVLPEIAKFSETQKEKILDAFSKWIESPSSRCDAEYTCPAVDTLKGTLNSLPCDQFRPIVGHFKTSVANYKNRGYFSQDRLVARNYEEALRTLISTEKKACESQVSPKPPTPMQNEINGKAHPAR